MLLIFIYTVFNFFSLLWLIFLCPFVGWWTPRNNGCCFIISLIILYWYIMVVCFLPWFYPKNYNAWNFFGCSMYGNVFLICCLTKHRAQTVELSFFSSLRMLLLFSLKSRLPRSTRPSVLGVLGAPRVHSQRSGSPRGTMDLWDGIWLTEFSHSFPCKFLSIIAMQGLWKSKHEKYILQRLYNLLACFGRQWDEPRIFAVMVVDVKYPIMTWGTWTMQISKVG